MQSAYNVLGVPGNASPKDIEDAFQRARSFYTQDKVAADSGVAERYTDVLNAYKILRDASSRAAHDRQLNAQSQIRPPAPRTASAVAGVQMRERRGVPLLLVLGVLTALVFGSGLFLQHKRETAKAALLAQQAEAARAEALAQAERARKEAEESSARQRRDALAAQQEQALRRDSEISMNRLQAAQQRQLMLDAQRAEQERRDARRKELERQAEDRRLNAESQRRVAADRARIRELCWLNYRKHDC